MNYKWIILRPAFGFEYPSYSITVKSGPLKGYVGTVEEISEDKKKIKVLVSMKRS